LLEILLKNFLQVTVGQAPCSHWYASIASLWIEENKEVREPAGASTSIQHHTRKKLALEKVQRMDERKQQ
jgi:hypothetical protein